LIFPERLLDFSHPAHAIAWARRTAAQVTRSPSGTSGVISIVRGNTHATAVMIGERAADLIR
jgi:hypothetical protein